MSQQLKPVDGGVSLDIQTTLNPNRLNVLSPQYIRLKKLETRPTEWRVNGRPIYDRLPYVSGTYRIDFFNFVTESNITGNTFTKDNVEEVGYVFIPYGDSINGASSLEVVASGSKQDLLIKGGTIIWKYGKNEILPTIVNLGVLDVLSGKYDIAYELIYDDSPKPFLYGVEDFALTGQPLNISSSTDSTIGWRYTAVNAFLNDSDLFWSNEDVLFPSYAQESSSYLRWESELSQAYSKITLRCPTGTSYVGTATLSYYSDGVLTDVSTIAPSSDKTGQYFEFSITDPVLQNGWNVAFTSNVSIQSITVSGNLTLLEKQSALSPRSRLVIYPAGTLPEVVLNGGGESLIPVYCKLAEIDVDDNFTITQINDQRSIIYREYVPVADWLTKPFDDDLINYYEQVSDYPKLWMNPTSAMKQEYATLSSDQISVEV